MITSTMNNGILEIAIDRAERKNALNHAMYDQLRDLFTEYGQDESCHAIILYGKNGFFTAGADLKDFQQKRGKEDPPAVRFLRALSKAEQPVIAAVEGFAIGIGSTLLQHCDFVYAANDSRFRMPFASLGLCPEGGSSLLLEQIVGRRRANDWLLSSRFFSAQEALEGGFVTALLEPGQALVKAREVAELLGTHPSYSIRLSKHMLRQGSADAVQKAFDFEAAMFAQCLARKETQASIKDTGKV